MPKNIQIYKDSKLIKFHPNDIVNSTLGRIIAVYVRITKTKCVLPVLAIDF